MDVEQLIQENERLKVQLAELVKLAERQQRDIKLLKDQLLRLQRRPYGLKADRFPEGQPSLFEEEAALAEASGEDGSEPDVPTPQEEIPKQKSRRKNKRREIDYAALPRKVERHEVDESERICPVTGKPLVEVDVKRTEKLEYQRAQLFVQVHEQVVYGLSEEDRKERRSPGKVADLPPEAEGNELAGASLLARILVAKYIEHLPLHRQEAIFGHEGLRLPRQTLCTWVMGALERLEPIVGALRERILAGDIVRSDDTRVLCQENSKKGPRQWAFLWAWLAEDEREVVFDFSMNRDHEVLDKWLGPEWSGRVVCDGYSAYRALCKARAPTSKVELSGCWSHARRKIKEAAHEAPADASHLAALMKALFKIEERAKELDPEARRALRLAESLPLLREIYAFKRKIRQAHPEQGALGKALAYLHNQRRALRRFLRDPRLPIHNNSTERAIRPVALGRKNWLFTGSPRGGRLGAVIYSLVESCKRAEVDPYEYLADVLVRVRTQPRDRMSDLVPLSWKQERERVSAAA